MTSTTLKAPLALSLLAFLCGCPTPPAQCITGDEDVCDAGVLPPDICNTLDEAKSLPDCALTLGTPKEGYITTLPDAGVDLDWYSVQLPALTARSLLHINAGYTVPQTAVNFAVNVLKADGITSIANGSDHHGAGAPRPVDIIMPFSESNTQLVVMVGDEGGTATPRVDNRNPYNVMVEVKDNPDPNEPNDTVATSIPLTAQTGFSGGTAYGYLATDNDIDLYSFTVPAGSRQIIYLHITDHDIATQPQYNPPLAYRLSYTLYDATMAPVAEGAMDNEFLVIDLATARLAATPGVYTLKITGYNPNGTSTVIKGDLRVRYDIDLRLYPDLDPNEPNDTSATAKVVNMTVGSTTTLTGRIAYVPDEEWFALTLPASPSAQTVVRYKLAVSNTPGRFPPLTTTPARQIRLLTEVTLGANATERLNNCKTNSAVCPKGYEGDVNKQSLVEAICGLQDPPQCLWSERDELLPAFPDLKNELGAIPVAPHSGPTTVFLMLRDVGLRAQKYADDKVWTMDVSLEADPDDTSRLAGPQVSSLSGSPSTASGILSFGYGRVIDPFDINRGDGIRAPQDYDAIPTDEDLFRFDFPSGGDQAWNLEWDLGTVDGGSPAGDLALDVTFCTGPATGTGPCPGTRRLIAYSPDPHAPWWGPQDYTNAQTLFNLTRVGNLVRITATPIGCWCFSAAQSAVGSFFINALAVNRTGNEPIPYTFRQSVSAYPQSYPAPDGGAVTQCPTAANSDGGVPGCGFVP